MVLVDDFIEEQVGVIFCGDKINWDTYVTWLRRLMDPGDLARDVIKATNYELSRRERVTTGSGFMVERFGVTTDVIGAYPGVARTRIVREEDARGLATSLGENFSYREFVG